MRKLIQKPTLSVCLYKLCASISLNSRALPQVDEGARDGKEDQHEEKWREKTEGLCKDREKRIDLSAEAKTKTSSEREN